MTLRGKVDTISILSVMYKVTLTKKAEKNLESLPRVIDEKFSLLLVELETLGPVR
jgi:mRNA-degrading endonuclease RelE of RelBE toxin-antitoxin system